MTDAATEASSRSDWVAPDCAGINFYECDAGLRQAVAAYSTE